MNLNKYTKAELISKLHKESKKQPDSKPNQNSILNQINLYFSQNFDLIMVFKNILVKLTLVSFFIQIFKRYKIFRRLWTMLNTLVMTIFGISLLDNFGFDFMHNFLIEIRIITANIIDYFSKTHFYVYLRDIFQAPSKDIEVNTEAPSSEQKNIPRKNPTDEPWFKESKKGNQESQRDSKISEWLKPGKEVIPNEQIEDTSSFVTIKDTWIKQLDINAIENIHRLEKICSGLSLGPDGKLIYVASDTVAILGKIIREYEISVDTYMWAIENKKFDLLTIEQYKEASFYFREWIYKYSDIVFQGKQGIIDVGTVNDAPMSICKKLLEDPLKSFDNLI